jgi:hypothetical protein
MDQTQRLVDRVDIIELINQYAAGMDMFDRALYSACFTDPVDIDFSSWDGTKHLWSVAEWVDYVWNLIEGLDCTQHIMTNHHVTFQSDDEATCVVYLHAQHYIQGAPAELFTAGGYYTNLVTRTPGGWKIRSCRFTMTWRAGDVGVLEVGQGRPARDDGPKGW